MKPKYKQLPAPIIPKYTFEPTPAELVAMKGWKAMESLTEKGIIGVSNLPKKSVSRSYYTSAGLVEPKYGNVDYAGLNKDVNIKVKNTRADQEQSRQAQVLEQTEEWRKAKRTTASANRDNYVDKKTRKWDDANPEPNMTVDEYRQEVDRRMGAWEDANPGASLQQRREAIPRIRKEVRADFKTRQDDWKTERTNARVRFQHEAMDKYPTEYTEDEATAFKERQAERAARYYPMPPEYRTTTNPPTKEELKQEQTQRTTYNTSIKQQVESGIREKWIAHFKTTPEYDELRASSRWEGATPIQRENLIADEFKKFQNTDQYKESLQKDLDDLEKAGKPTFKDPQYSTTAPYEAKRWVAETTADVATAMYDEAIKEIVAPYVLRKIGLSRRKGYGVIKKCY